MMSYKRIAVASTFSPTFDAVLMEADRFAHQCGASLEVLHVAEFEKEKEARFFDVLGRAVAVRWLSGETPAAAIASAVGEYSYDLVVAGALQREDGDKPFTSGVARDLLRLITCDLMLLPAPAVEGRKWEHLVFVFEPGEDCASFLDRATTLLGAKQVTITAAETPFAAALATSRGEEPCDARAWSDGLVESLRQKGLQAEAWVVTSNTGYSLCDSVQGIPADLLVVKAGSSESREPLPVHVNWLYQVIPMRLLVVRRIADG